MNDVSDMSDLSDSGLRERVVKAMRSVHDPELPVNIYDLGLIYGLDISAEGVARVRMTLTSPNCPVADKLPADVQRAVRAVEGVTGATVELTFDPPWGPERMSEAAQIELQAMGIDPMRPNETAGAKFARLTFGRKGQRT